MDRTPVGELADLIRSDLYRYTAAKDLASFVETYRTNPGFRYSVWFRVYSWLRSGRPRRPVSSRIAGLVYWHLSYKYGITIPPMTVVGPGLYIGHFGGIVIHPGSVLGKNSTIQQNVTVGQTNRGDRKGIPSFGDNVFLGPGCVVIGGIHIGSDAAIGANCLANKDVPDRGVVVGVPGKVISLEGSWAYVNNTVD